MGRKFKLSLLGLYAFYVIYAPTPINNVLFSPYVVTTILLLVIIFFYILKKDKSLISLLNDQRIKLFIGLIIASGAYFACLALLKTNDPSIRDLRLVQSFMPVVYLGHALIIIDKLRKLGFGIVGLLKFLLLLGAGQGILSILMLVFPSFHEIALHLYYLDRPENVFISATRIYGLSNDYTFSTPIYHAILAGTALIMSLMGVKGLLRYIPLILVAILFNSGTGLVVFIIFALLGSIYVLFFTQKTFASKLIVSATMILGTIVSVFLLSILAPNIYRYLNYTIETTQLFIFEGKIEGNYGPLFRDGLFLPSGASIIVGEGHRVYGTNAAKNGYDNSSDIGYVNDLFMGGLIYVTLLYGAYAILILRSVDKNDKISRYITIGILLSLAIANYKGEILKSSIVIFLVFYLTTLFWINKTKIRRDQHDGFSSGIDNAIEKNFHMPKVSIILPVYNVRAYLADAIKSLIEQTYKNMEIILVDDGSTDGSSRLCDDFAKKDRRIKVIHKRNEGVAVARNIGLDNASGKYILFVDSDDLIDRDTIAATVDCAENNNLNIVSFRYKLFSDTLPKPCFYTDDKVRILNGRSAVNSLLYQKEIANAVFAKLYRAESIGDIRFRPGVKIAEDLDFNYWVIKNTRRVGILERAFYYYRQRAGSAIRSGDKIQRRRAIEIVRDFLVDARKRGDGSNTNAAKNRLFMEAVFAAQSLDRQSLKGLEDEIADVFMDLRKVVFFDNHSRVMPRIYAMSAFFGTKAIMFLVNLRSKGQV